MRAAGLNVLVTGGGSSGQIINRQEALSAGLKRYFTGAPCIHGHVAERLVSNMSCMECSQHRFKRYYETNADALRDKTKDYRSTDEFKKRRREARRQQGDEYRALRRAEYAANADRERARVAAYRAVNPDAVKQASRKWQRNNQHIKTAAQRLRGARELNATPTWADQATIKEVYREAARLSKETGISHEVDHIYPLQGKTVCGLHVANNLRPIPALLNRRKNNKMPDDTP